jgi:hypothetical protein
VPSLLQKPFIVSVGNLFLLSAGLADTIFMIPKIAHFLNRLFPTDTKNQFSKKNSEPDLGPSDPDPGPTSRRLPMPSHAGSAAQVGAAPSLGSAAATAWPRHRRHSGLPPPPLLGSSPLSQNLSSSKGKLSEGTGMSLSASVAREMMPSSARTQ